MIEHKHGAFVHRQDPLLVARVVAMKRENMGEFHAIGMEARSGETGTGSTRRATARPVGIAQGDFA